MFVSYQGFGMEKLSVRKRVSMNDLIFPWLWDLLKDSRGSSGFQRSGAWCYNTPPWRNFEEHKNNDTMNSDFPYNSFLVFTHFVRQSILL